MKPGRRGNERATEHKIFCTSMVILGGFLVLGAARFPASWLARACPSSSALPSGWSAQTLGAPLLRDPIWVYNDWSAYKEQSIPS